MLERFQNHLQATIDCHQRLLATLGSTVAQVAKIMADALQFQRKILVCGNGGSCAQAQHFSAELINRYQSERPSLAAIALTADTASITAIANDYAYDQIFSKQIEGLGQAGDILFILTTSGQSKNIMAAINAAHRKNMLVVALTGKNGGEAAQMLKNKDIEIRIPNSTTSHIQEAHQTIIHCLCDLIDHQLFTKEN